MFKRQQHQILINGDPQKDRSIKKHQKRLSSGAATRIPYPGLSEALRGASGTLLGTSLQLKNYQDSILGEIVPLLGNVKKYSTVLKLELGVSDFVIQDFLSHGISIPIWPSNKVSKKLIKMLRENCQIDQSAMWHCGLINPKWLAMSRW